MCQGAGWGRGASHGLQGFLIFSSGRARGRVLRIYTSICSHYPIKASGVKETRASLLKGGQSFLGASFHFLDLSGTAVLGGWENIPVVLSGKWKWLRRGCESLENQVNIRSRNPVSLPKEERRQRQPECPWEVLPSSWPIGDRSVLVPQQKGGGGAVPGHWSVPGLLDLF